MSQTETIHSAIVFTTRDRQLRVSCSCGANFPGGYADRAAHEAPKSHADVTPAFAYGGYDLYPTQHTMVYYPEV